MDRQSIEVWNMLESQGSVDWAGLPMVVGLLGVEDIDGLMMRLKAIKQYLRESAARKD
jgi:hypothetical protein